MSEIIKYLNEIKNTDKVALFGAGSFGKYVFDRLKDERSDIKVVVFIDDKRKDDFQGLPVCDLKTFLSDYQDVKIIVTSSYWQPISEKVSTYMNDFYIADILNSERQEKIFKKSIGNADICFYTPNQFLYEVANRLDDIEPYTNKWIKTFSEAVFFDIGASCGVYSILAGIKNNTVITIEPDALNFSIIKRNLFLNNKTLKGNFIPLNLALGSKKEILTLNMLEFGEGFHGRFTSNSDRSANNMFYSEKVMAYNLDQLITDFDLPSPTHIKIDVDGAEFDVLSGMKNTLSNPSLKEMLIEMNSDQEAQIIEVLRSHGLQFSERQKINEITGTEVHGVANLLFKRKQN